MGCHCRVTAITVHWGLLTWLPGSKDQSSRKREWSSGVRSGFVELLIRGAVRMKVKPKVQARRQAVFWGSRLRHPCERCRGWPPLRVRRASSRVARARVQSALHTIAPLLPLSLKSASEPERTALIDFSNGPAAPRTQKVPHALRFLLLSAFTSLCINNKRSDRYRSMPDRDCREKCGPAPTLDKLQFLC